MGISQPNVPTRDSGLTQEKLNSLSIGDKDDFIRNWLNKIEMNEELVISSESLEGLEDNKMEYLFDETDDDSVLSEENLNLIVKNKDYKYISSDIKISRLSQNTTVDLDDISDMQSFKLKSHPKKSNEVSKDKFKDYLELLVQNNKVTPEKIIYLKQIKTNAKRLDPLRAFLVKKFSNQK